MRRNLVLIFLAAPLIIIYQFHLLRVNNQSLLILFPQLLTSRSL
jgi:hypothetical protein